MKNSTRIRNKKIIIIGAILLTLVLVFILNIIFFKGNFEKAKEIWGRVDVGGMFHNEACEQMRSRVEEMISTGEYESIVEKCRAVIERNDGAIKEMEEAKSNFVIRVGLERFQKSYERAKTIQMEQERLYTVWHKFYLKFVENATINAEADKLTEAAKILKESGNSELARFGEEWLEKRKALTEAYNKFHSADYGVESYEKNSADYQAALKSYEEWYYNNKINIAEVAQVDSGMEIDLQTRYEELKKYLNE